MEVLSSGECAVLASSPSHSEAHACPLATRHEICFVFGELAHPSSVPSMLRVLSDSAEHEMVRHEAAEALGAVAEDAEEQDVQSVLKELKRWAEDLEAPRVVRESCVVALDELKCQCRFKLLVRQCYADAFLFHHRQQRSYIFPACRGAARDTCRPRCLEALLLKQKYVLQFFVMWLVCVSC